MINDNIFKDISKTRHWRTYPGMGEDFLAADFS
jgi:hypothetical protein